MRKDYFTIAIRNLKSRTLRSWLTIIGIIIGVFLVVFLLSLSQGIKGAIMQQLSMMGSDVIMVSPGDITNPMNMFAGGLRLSEDDLRTIEKTEGVEEVIPQDWKGEVVRYGGERKTVFVYGMPFDKSSDMLISKMGMEPAEGRFPREDKREVILGAMVSKDIFPGIDVGDRVDISGRQFQVVGILKSLGNKNDDSMVGLDLEMFRQITGQRKGAPFTMLTIKPGYPQDEVAENVKSRLQEVRKRQVGEDQPSVSVITSEKATDMVGNVLGIVQAAIFLIAAFAILVGAIGIMNTMYTSVRERTKDIGIMKAVGAKTTDISYIFLIESGTMGFIGGLGGTILGGVGAKLVEIFMKMGSTIYIKAHLSIFLILGSLIITSLIGCLSGYFPARKASKLQPVEALHYD